MKEQTIEVDAEALFQLLQAVNGPAHYILELKAISTLPNHDCPIKKLIKQYNDWAEK